MLIYSFDGTDLKMMLRGAIDFFKQSKDEIDSLNVFPVPDGDTGTNMYQTLLSAVDEACKMDSSHIGLVAEASARGSLIGARGNSGVILSQFLYGFARSLQTKEKASASDIINALKDGAQKAYSAVMSPVEGTILTVVRKSAEGAAAQHSENLLRIMVTMIHHALTALQETPDLLPVLKQAGVVDAGGKGFVVILEGFLHALKSASPAAKNIQKPVFKKAPEKPFHDQFKKNELTQVIDCIYCTELLLKGENLPLEEIKNKLLPYGDSLMVVGDKELAKIHIHSNHPGMVLESCLRYGTMHDLKINNMAEQSLKLSEKSTPDGYKHFGIISVGAGAGLTNIMKNLGVDAVLTGGQTFNPSTGEILALAEEVPAEKIIILPNNKNVILAAEQAGKLSRKEISVIPAKSIPQGISALLTLNPQDDFSTMVTKMKAGLSSVKTGEITTAVRDTTYKEMEIKKEEYIGLAEGDLIVNGTDITVVLKKLLEKIIDGKGLLITLYRGEAIDAGLAKELAGKMQKVFIEQDFELQYGGQPVYHFIISVE